LLILTEDTKITTQYTLRYFYCFTVELDTIVDIDWR